MIINVNSVISNPGGDTVEIFYPRCIKYKRYRCRLTMRQPICWGNDDPGQQGFPRSSQHVGWMWGIYGHTLTTAANQRDMASLPFMSFHACKTQRAGETLFSMLFALLDLGRVLRIEPTVQSLVLDIRKKTSSLVITNSSVNCEILIFVISTTGKRVL